VTKSYQGLLSVHQVATDGALNVTLYWTSKDHYCANRDMLLGVLPCREISYEGYLASIQAKSQDWTEATWKEWLIAASAVWGALTALGALFPVLFALPEADYQIRIAKRDFFQGARIELQATVRNTDRSAALEIKDPAVWLSADGEPRVDLAVSPKVIKKLDAGNKFDLDVSGFAPAGGPTGTKRPGYLTPKTYQLQATAKVTAGLIWSWRPSITTAQPVDLKIWRNVLSWDLPHLAESATPRTIAAFTGQLYSGSSLPKGAQGSITILPIRKEVPIRQIQLKCNPVACASEPVKSADDGSAYVAQVSTDSLAEFQTVQYQITVVSLQELAPQEWKEMTGKIKVFFGR
jgi:hypothetical protein